MLYIFFGAVSRQIYGGQPAPSSLAPPAPSRCTFLGELACEDVHGNSQKETFELEKKSDLSEANLNNGTRVVPYLKKINEKKFSFHSGSGQDCASVLCSCRGGFPGEACGGAGPRGPDAQESLGGQDCMPSGRSEMGTSEDEPNALLEGSG